jgi:probable ATP-dependent RNA helicase DDX4
VGGACTDVSQAFYQSTKYEKREKFINILNQPGRDPKERTLVFVETKRQADFLCLSLCEEGFPATSIHGDRMQSEREQALRDFKSAKKPVLVATAVAARGLDIKDVMHVVKYVFLDANC